MGVKVMLENVGGLSGVHAFNFVKGAVNVVKAPNAAGKTTLIKAIASCLSAPYRSKSSIQLAREMGLLRQAGEPVEPLVHVGAEAAKITVKLNGEEWRYTLLKEGKYAYTREGDDRFLITSVLVRDSKVLEKLKSGDTDFKWIVEMVSLASRYEAAAATLEGEKARVGELLEQVERRREEVESLRKEERALRETISKYKREEDLLNRELTELLAKHPEVSKLRKRRDGLMSKIRSLRDEAEEIRGRMERLKRRIDEEAGRHKEKLVRKERLEKESGKLFEERVYVEERLETVNRQLEGYEEQLKNISEKIETLRTEEGRLLAESELYERALKLASQAGRVRCFLCKQGYLTAEALEQRRLLAKRRLSEVRDKIAVLLSKRNNIYSLLEERKELKTRLKEVRKRLSEVASELQILEKYLKGYTVIVNSLRRELTSLEGMLKRVERERAKYENELDSVNEAVRSLGKKEQEIVGRLAEVRGRLSELEKRLNEVVGALKLKSHIEIAGHSLLLENAEGILSAWAATIDEALRRLRTEVRRERVAAIELFNSQVRKVLEDSRFEYLDVWVDASDYKLHILDRRTGSEVTPRVLSETEGYMLAFVIHAALKLAYTPHIPFFLIDEVALSFDEARKKAVLKYLSNLARENSWVVIVTELGHEPEIATTVLTGL